MRSLYVFTINCTVFLTLTSCLVSCRGTPQDDRIPKGESCIIRSNDAYCIDKIADTQQFKSLREIRGYEAIDMDYKAELEDFIYELMEENDRLRAGICTIEDGDN